MKRFIFSLFLITTITTSLNAQIDHLMRKHVKVYEAADSIITNLYTSGVDTLFTMHRVWAWEKQKNYDGNAELHSSLIFWCKKGAFYYQRVNEYAIYEPKREYRMDSELLYLFKYYFIHQQEIEANPIPHTLLSSSDDGKSVKELVYAGGDFNVLSYRVSKTTSQQYWYTPNLRLDDSPHAYEIFASKSYTWASLIEREFRKAINIYWKPINEKVEPVEDVSDFLGGMEGELNKWKAAADFYTEAHQYKRQEILIPTGFSGVITIVQEQPCGKKLQIKREVRTITIPTNGNLILDKKYISYFQEYGFAAERQKTTAFFVKGNKREPLTILGETSKPDDVGLSVLGEFTSNINSKKYKIVVMHIGLQKEARTILDQQNFYNDKLPARLADCK